MPSSSFNRVILLGNITRDIEVKYLSSGTAVAEFGLAVTDRRKSAAGEWIEETSFIDIVLFGRSAEVAGEYLGKGSPVLIEGRLKQETWEKDGQKRSKLRVIGERLQMLGRSGGDRSHGPAGTGDENESSEHHETASSMAAHGPGDDIPF